MGTLIESFIENVRGLLRAQPDFFEQFDGYQPEKSLEKMGFTQVDATEKEKELTMILNKI